MYKSLLSAAFFFVSSLTTVYAHEGMWLPNTLKSLVIGDMQSAGLKLSAEDIYSINKSSLKDAIVHFGGGCTASIISNQGLILTNHHCGYSQIQSHSSLKNDLLRDGFWAESQDAELPNSGLTASIVVRIEDVTAALLNLKGASTEETEELRRKKASELTKAAVDGTHYEAEIKPFYYGNAYYMIVTETFRDVRLAGAPPSAVGKFGGDTDNWEWPRHTGDFSIFRIYANPDNKPADYSELNKPYIPKWHLKIDLAGVNPGDFTMVLGYPGRTDRYISSAAVAYLLDFENPARIDMREASLGVIDAAMASSDLLRIKYAAKQSRISNAYKKWIGQSSGLISYNVVEKKKALETRFQLAAIKNPAHAESSTIPDSFKKLYREQGDSRLARTYYTEFYFYGPEIIRYSAGYKLVAEKYDSLKTAGVLEEHLTKLRKGADGFFKNYDPIVDQAIFAAQLPIYIQGAPEAVKTAQLKELYASNSSATDAVRSLFNSSIFSDEAYMKSMLSGMSKKQAKQLRNDPMLSLSTDLVKAYGTNVQSASERFQTEEDALMHSYMDALMTLMPAEIGSPDANSTLRITYGEMEGSEPRDGLVYKAYTTFDGLVAKYIPGDEEFDLPQRLLDLHKTGEYGPYAVDGELRVCFLGSNHTTGGNSGSPALNAKGHLIGLNFDRTWESTMSDIVFNGEVCRNIMVDIRYVLFIVDRYANATNLIEEMTLIYPPVKAKAKRELQEVEPDMN